MAVQATARNRPTLPPTRQLGVVERANQAVLKAKWMANQKERTLSNPTNLGLYLASKVPIPLVSTVLDRVATRREMPYDTAKALAIAAKQSWLAGNRRGNPQRPQDAVFTPQSSARTDRPAGFGKERQASPAQAKPQEVWRPRQNVQHVVGPADYLRMRHQGGSAHQAHAPTSVQAAAHTRFRSNFGGSAGKPRQGVRVRGR